MLNWFNQHSNQCWSFLAGISFIALVEHVESGNWGWSMFFLTALVYYLKKAKIFLKHF